MVRILQRKFIFASMSAVTILLLTLVAAVNLLNYVSVTGRQKQMLEMICEADGLPENLARKENRKENGGEGSGRNRGKGQEQDRRQSRDAASEKNAGRPDSQPGRKFSMDDAMSARFFAVWFDRDGGIVRTDVTRIYAVTEEGAREMAQAILQTGKKEGTYGGFRFLLCEKAAEEDTGAAEEDTGAAEENTGTAEEGTEAAGNDEKTAEENTAAAMLAAMDISGDNGDLLFVLGVCAGIAAVCWLLMLLPVLALARRAIAPTAMSIERQKQFVTNAGHELKTPLAIIQANTDALELYHGENKWTRNIRTQTVRLSGLMQNLLTLSRMDEESLILEKKPFRLDALAREVWENFAESAKGRDLTVVFEPAGDLPETGPKAQAYGNRESIAQLLSILYDNAVRYTPRGGQIRVRTCVEANGAVLVQSNTASSLPEEPERLFERFYRADEDRSRKKGGSGIGLSAARAIAGANGGAIRAHAEDGMLVFTLQLQTCTN